MATKSKPSPLDADDGVVCDYLDAYFGDFIDDELGVIAKGLVVDIDPATLANVATNYVYDLKRYKNFHELEDPDNARRAAYLCKWLTRLRPVKVLSDYNEQFADQHLMANELFALYVVSGILKIDLGSSLSTRMLNMFLYSMRYRASSEDTFILFFAQLCKLT